MGRRGAFRRLATGTILYASFVVAGFTAPSPSFPGVPKTTLDAKKTEAEIAEVLEQFKAGDEFAFFELWDRIADSRQDGRWKAKSLEKLAAPIQQMRIADQLGMIGRNWHPVFESILARTSSDLLEQLPAIAALAAAHAFDAVVSDSVAGHMEWFHELPPETGDFYFRSLKDRNRFFRELRLRVNPDGIDPARLPPEPRLTYVERFLSTPHFRRVQPYNNKTFAQLLSRKCLTPEELFDNREAFVTAHERQGMAYLDLARIYRKEGHHEEALDHIAIGLTLHNHKGNRVGCYLLEKAIILREMGNPDESRAVLDAIPKDELDQHNTNLFAQVASSVEEK